MKRTVSLIILDGWGDAPPGPGNALSQARLPHWRQLLSKAPHRQLITSGEAVGLPKGQAGNSNVGHLNIGAGRVVDQDIIRISKLLDSGALFSRPAAAKVLQAKRLHLMTLFSTGGVHAYLDHLEKILAQLAENGMHPCLHLFFDGRDVGPKTAGTFLERLKRAGGAQIATVSGRFYAMDRDKRWDRTEKAYRAIVEAAGPHFGAAEEALASAYGQGVTDEFVEPSVVGDYTGAQPGDTFFFLNFRADRARQLSHALSDPEFAPFSRPRGTFELVTMTEYDETLTHAAHVLSQELPEDALGPWLAAAGKTQCRIAETEKYAHVTYFLDGGRDMELAGEKRILLPSPKVKTYDMAPEMRSLDLAREGAGAIRSGDFDFMVLNFAAPDMVGHTGDIRAAISAVETVDEGIGLLQAAVDESGGSLMFIADHGNVETLIDPKTGGPLTSHTANPVPVLLYRPAAKEPFGLRDGILADVAPTVLDLLGMERPQAMTGRSLITHTEAKS